MKKIIITGFLMIVFMGSGFCEGPSINSKLALQGYIQAMKSDNPGLQMSGMQNLVKLKMAFPELNCRKAFKVLSVIIRDEKLSSVRICATLTHLLLTDTQMLEIVKDTDHKDPMVYFNDVFRQMNEHLNRYRIENIS